MLFQGDFGGVYDGIIIVSSGCKKNVYAPEGLALQMCGTGTTQMIKSFMLSEKKYDMNPIPPDLRMFFHLSILVFLGTECTL